MNLIFSSLHHLKPHILQLKQHHFFSPSRILILIFLLKKHKPMLQPLKTLFKVHRHQQVTPDHLLINLHVINSFNLKETKLKIFFISSWRRFIYSTCSIWFDRGVNSLLKLIWHYSYSFIIELSYGLFKALFSILFNCRKRCSSFDKRIRSSYSSIIVLKNKDVKIQSSC